MRTRLGNAENAQIDTNGSVNTRDVQPDSLSVIDRSVDAMSIPTADMLAGELAVEQQRLTDEYVAVIMEAKQRGCAA